MTDANTVETKFYIDEILTMIKDANPEAAKQIALAVESETKLNIRDNGQIDTGFMVNSVYSITKDGSGYAAAKAKAEGQTTNRKGETVDHTGDMAQEPAIDSGALAGVGVGAEYAIYQEVAKPFLYPAAEAVAAKVGATVKTVFNEMVSDSKGGYEPTGNKVVS